MEEEEESGGEEGAPAWMATFSDMATLLLTFFVLLLSFANMDVQNFKMALGSVKQALGVQFEVNGDFHAMSTSPVELSQRQSSRHLDKVEHTTIDAKRIKKFVADRKLEKHVSVIPSARGVILRIKDLVLFDAGSDELRDEAAPVLELVAQMMLPFKGTLSIEGHTDDTPISRDRFPSNWELSTARSTAVLRHLVSEHDVSVKRLRVAGYADARPVADNATFDGKAKNRRVEFVFERSVAVPGSAPGSPKKGPDPKLEFTNPSVP